MAERSQTNRVLERAELDEEHDVTATRGESVVAASTSTRSTRPDVHDRNEKQEVGS